MSRKLINHNADLLRLQNEGYELEIKGGSYLLIHSVPYVNSRKEVAFGTIVTDLTLNNEKTQKPGNHQVWFTGDYPCYVDGRKLPVGNGASTRTLCDGLVIHHHLSCKPKEGYKDYYEKMSRYVEIISNQAKAIDSTLTACNFKPIHADEDEHVFNYTDTASSRAGISNLNSKLCMGKVAIVGLGGTGSYILDLIAKTHIKEIHLFDGDLFLQHNAFRSPGAPSNNDLENKKSKASYFKEIYSKMRRGIYGQDVYIDESNIEMLHGFDFVFLSVDKSAVRKLVSEYLHRQKIPFVDVGMDLELVEETQNLVGICRTTLSTPEKNAHYHKHVSLHESSVDELYKTNIQVAELNALNATMAVIKWKKFCSFYQDCYKEHQSVYAINAHQLTRDEIS